MSGSKASPSGGADQNVNDPSMEDILASIRRILSEEEPAAPAPPESGVEQISPEEKPDDVLVLDSSMLVAQEQELEADPPPAVSEAVPAIPDPPPAVAEPPPFELTPPPKLLAPEAEDAATVSMGNLVRTLATERTAQVHRGGPTIEDVVREELRPLLKQWLDANLPDLVERLVRVEIERVVHRAMP
jgi:cell pole-organizing protein PopZ